MNDRRKTGKVDRVSATTAPRPTEPTQRVTPTDAIRSIDAVRPTSGVEGVNRIGSIASTDPMGRALTRAQRDRLMGMVKEEADKLFATGMIPSSQREVIKRAVMMAIDSTIIVEETENSPRAQAEVSDGPHPVDQNESDQQEP